MSSWLSDLDVMRRLDPEPGEAIDPRLEWRLRREGHWHDGCVRNAAGRHVLLPCKRAAS